MWSRIVNAAADWIFLHITTAAVLLLLRPLYSQHLTQIRIKHLYHEENSSVSTKPVIVKSGSENKHRTEVLLYWMNWGTKCGASGLYMKPGI